MGSRTVVAPERDHGPRGESQKVLQVEPDRLRELDGRARCEGLINAQFRRVCVHAGGRQKRWHRFWAGGTNGVLGGPDAQFREWECTAIRPSRRRRGSGREQHRRLPRSVGVSFLHTTGNLKRLGRREVNACHLRGERHQNYVRC